MSQRVTKCTVCGQAGHTRIHCLVLCGSCSGDCGCEQPPAKKKQKTKKGRKVAGKEQLQVAATGSPEAQPNYKSICRQLQQKNQQLGKAYHDLKAQFDELKIVAKRKKSS